MAVGCSGIERVGARGGSAKAETYPARVHVDTKRGPGERTWTLCRSTEAQHRKPPRVIGVRSSAGP